VLIDWLQAQTALLPRVRKATLGKGWCVGDQKKSEETVK
jgi:hypothetical protein